MEFCPPEERTEIDPFREERHYSRFALVYGLMIVVVVGLGFALYHFKYRHAPPLENENTEMRRAIQDALDEEY